MELRTLQLFLEVADQKNDCHRYQQGSKVGKAEKRKLRFNALTEKMLDKFLHNIAPRQKFIELYHIRHR